MSSRAVAGQEAGAMRGVRAFAGGIGFVLTTPSVWPFACVPIVIALLLLCGLSGVGFWAAGRMSTWLIADSTTGSQVWQWLVTLLAGLLFLAGAVVVALVLAQPLSGWALEAIARRQEMALTGQCAPEPSFLRSLWISVRCALVTVIIAVGLSVILFIVELVFPPVMIVTVPLRFFLLGWLLAWDFVDYPLGLRGKGLRARLTWVSAHFAEFTAFGLAWAVVLLIPGIALLVLPMGVAGAARLVVASEQEAEVVDVVR